MNKPYEKGTAWADPSSTEIASLVVESRSNGWRTALKRCEHQWPFFAMRMRNLSLGNWQLVFFDQRRERSLDVGCGFGSLPLGMSYYYNSSVGLDLLPERVYYAALRAQQDHLSAGFVRGSGLSLPFRSMSFDLVSFNGVIEWAGLFGNGHPEDLQIQMLREARRVLFREGHIGVAIENRYALESILGMPDTHTGIKWVTLTPRCVSNIISRVLKGEHYKTYLYSVSGYTRLLQSAGFQEVEVLDLISSYNKYDFILRIGDHSSYRYLFSKGLVKPIDVFANIVRRFIGRMVPSALHRFSYAYLILGGNKVITALDTTSELWNLCKSYGVDAGPARFACKGDRPGEIAVIVHDGEKVLAMVEIIGTKTVENNPSHVLSDRLHADFASSLKPIWIEGQTRPKVRVWR